MQAKINMNAIGLSHASGSLSFSQTMWVINKLLFLLLLWGVIIFGLRALGLVLLSISSALVSEIILILMRSLKSQGMEPPSENTHVKHTLRNELANGSSFFYGFIFGLSLPVTAHWLIAVLGPIIAICLVKWGLGGIGNFWINPALSARLFLELNWPHGFRSYNWGSSIFSTIGWNVDALSAASDSASIKQFMSENIIGDAFRPLSLVFREFSSVDEFITRFLNENIFIPSGSILPEGYIDYMLGFRYGAIGETSVIFILLLSVIVFARGIIQWQTPLFAVLTMAILSFLFSGVFYGAEPLRGDALFALANNGFLFIVFFVLTDPNTGSYSYGGKILYGIIFSSLSFIMWEVSLSSHSQTIALLFANCLAQAINLLRIKKPVYISNMRNHSEEKRGKHSG